MKEWHIIHECDTENGTPTQWSLNMVNMYGLNLHIITLMT